MTTMRLGDRGVVRVGGGDAGDFLQGLVTADIESLAEGAPVFGALLTPQGKILFDFIVHARDGEFLLDCPSEAVADLMRRLGMYRLRSRVEIEDATETLAVVAEPDRGEPPDPRLDGLGARRLVPAGDAPEQDGSSDYHAGRVRLGVAECWRDFLGGEAFPHEANYDALHGVSLAKGCFVGQEVVSRMHHRGTARRRFLPCRLEGEPAPVGTEVTLEGRTVGAAGSAAGGVQLALLRLDRIAPTLDGPAVLEAGPARLSPTIPDWLDGIAGKGDGAAE